MYLNTLLFSLISALNSGLTLTWDVFKCKKIKKWPKGSFWLTLTWDVFKCNTE